MTIRADELRQKITYYRRRLAEGAQFDLADAYLRAIAEAEAELARLMGEEKPRE